MKAILLGCAFSLLAMPSFGADLAALPSKAPALGSFFMDELLRRRASRRRLGKRQHH